MAKERGKSVTTILMDVPNVTMILDTHHHMVPIHTPMIGIGVRGSLREATLGAI